MLLVCCLKAILQLYINWKKGIITMYSVFYYVYAHHLKILWKYFHFMLLNSLKVLTTSLNRDILSYLYSGGGRQSSPQTVSPTLNASYSLKFFRMWGLKCHFEGRNTFFFCLLPGPEIVKIRPPPQSGPELRYGSY